MSDGREARQQTPEAAGCRGREDEARTSQSAPPGETPARRVREAGAGGGPPRWDAAAGELWWRGVFLKRVRPDAANQRLVLDAFQRWGWPARIDSPFPPGPGPERKQRLRNAVKALNGRLRSPGLRFHTDRGGGVGWEAII